jgi:predicted metal-dependent hydrolase
VSKSRLALTQDQLLARRAMAWATKIGVNPSRVVIADLMRKWGSCAPDGVVTFAKDLADQPSEFQDYVIVHELLHLRYRSHGKRFTAMMTALVPSWRQLEASGAPVEPGGRAVERN